MRGRKQASQELFANFENIKKESPNEGTETSDEATRFRLGSKAG